MSDKRALVLGVTGQLGKLVAQALRQYSSVQIRVTSRRKEELPELQKQYGEAVYLDLAEPRTFGDAIQGVNSLFLLTGYTVEMLVQSKALVDAARRAGVKHIVHLGVFSPDEDCYDAHFAWHQMIEAYISVSGISYTFLHPNCFLQNFTGFYGIIKDGTARYYTNKSLGWIALEDVGEASAKILAEGDAHFGKDYWFSTESANLTEVLKTFNEVTGKTIVSDVQPPGQFLKDFVRDGKSVDPYFLAVADCFVQIEDGRMGYLGTVRDDMQTLFGRPGISIRQWANLHRDKLLALSK